MQRLVAAGAKALGAAGAATCFARSSSNDEAACSGIAEMEW